jgi:hypothetical protein
MTEQQSEFQKIIQDLTPEEKKLLRESNEPEWKKSIRNFLNDKEFWEEMLQVCIAGFIQGMMMYLDNKDYNKNKNNDEY